MAAADDRAWAEAALRGALISDEVLALGAEAWQELADPYQDEWEAILGRDKVKEVMMALRPMGLSGPSMSCKPCG